MKRTNADFHRLIAVAVKKTRKEKRREAENLPRYQLSTFRNCNSPAYDSMDQKVSRESPFLIVDRMDDWSLCLARAPIT